MSLFVSILRQTRNLLLGFGSLAVGRNFTINMLDQDSSDSMLSLMQCFSVSTALLVHWRTGPKLPRSFSSRLTPVPERLHFSA